MKIFVKISKAIKYRIAKLLRKIFIMPKKIKKLKNYDFSLLSSNCNGAILLNELKLQFKSPTVDLYLEAQDFIKFLEDLNAYLNMELSQKIDEEMDYPMGKLGDLDIHFVHYTNFEQAKSAWIRRRERINMNNLFIMMTDRDGCTEDIIARFDRLPYANKVIFTHKMYPQYKSSYYIKGYENEPFIGQLYELKNILGYKGYDEFDYISWFNGNDFHNP